MSEEPQDWSEHEDEEQQAEELLSSIRESKPRREVLIAEKTRHLKVDPNDPAMIFPGPGRKMNMAHAVVLYRSPEGLPLHIVDSWAPLDLIPVTTLADRDLHDLIPWLVRNRRTNPRRAREQVFVMRAPTKEESEQLEVFPDEPVIHVGRWLFDGNDTLLLVQRHVLRRGGLLIYERDLEFEVLFPPAFVGGPMGVTE